MLRRSILLSCVWAACACAHNEPVPAARSVVPPPATASVAPSLARTPEPAAPRSEPKPPAATAPEPQKPVDIAAFMQDHFVITTWARDAVAEGDLAALRQPLLELSTYRYGDVQSGGWMSYVAQLQAAAGLTARAESRGAAAAGVAAMGRLCGECHVHNRVQIAVELRLPSEPAPEVESLSARMFRHQWASARLWEGLTVPSDEAWQQGALVLAESAARAPSSVQPLPEAALRMLRDVRELGVHAAEANTLAERADSYARLLAMCAECHASVRAR